MKWCKRGYVLAAILALASATIQAADVTITVNGKVVAKPCTVSTTNATVVHSFPTRRSSDHRKSVV